MGLFRKKQDKIPFVDATPNELLNIANKLKLFAKKKNFNEPTQEFLEFTKQIYMGELRISLETPEEIENYRKVLSNFQNGLRARVLQEQDENVKMMIGNVLHDRISNEMVFIRNHLEKIAQEKRYAA